MRHLSSNMRARAAELYRLGSVHDVRVTPACEHMTDSEHIDDHKAEFYGLVAQLSNATLRRTLDSRHERGSFGLMNSGRRPARDINSSRSLHRLMTCTLQDDAVGVILDNPELVGMVDEYLYHLKPIDQTMHRDAGQMLNGGVHTAVEAMQNTYEVLTSANLRLSEEQLIDSWRTVLDQARLGVREFLALPGIYHDMTEREEVFELSEDDIAVFCAHAIRVPAKLDYIVERETIGCPVTFEPALVREFWVWYVGLRASVG